MSLELFCASAGAIALPSVLACSRRLFAQYYPRHRQSWYFTETSGDMLNQNKNLTLNTLSSHQSAVNACPGRTVQK
jgi:hypothetical protein